MVDEIKIGRRGYVNAQLLVHGKQGHSAYAERAENPIPKLARIVDRLSSTPLDKGSEHFQPSSLQATIVSVPNTATNVIPGSARANFNIRYNDLHTRPKIEAWVREHCEIAAKEVGARFSLSFEGTGNVFLTKPGPLVDTMPIWLAWEEWPRTDRTGMRATRARSEVRPRCASSPNCRHRLTSPAGRSRMPAREWRGGYARTSASD